jgi:uncharacterized membrane protein YGL010W
MCDNFYSLLYNNELNCISQEICIPVIIIAGSSVFSEFTY